MTSPLSRAWATLIRYPLLALIPMLWEGIMFWLALGLGGARYPSSESGSTHGFSVKFLLPSALPAGAELIGASNNTQIQAIAMDNVLGVLIPNILGAFVMAGYLYLLTRALDGESPSWRRFTEGARRFGPRMLLWDLLVLVVVFLVALLVIAIPPLGLAAALLLAVLYVLVPFIIVARDMALPEALTGAPGALRRHLIELLPICLASVALSAVGSLVLTATGLGTLLLASPLWAWFGTWVTLAVLAVLGPQEQYS